MRPVLEEEPATIDQPVEPRAVVRAEAGPHGQIVRAVEDVDGIELEPTHVLDKATETLGGQRGRLRAGEMLPLQEERGHGAQRNAAAWHAAQRFLGLRDHVLGEGEQPAQALRVLLEHVLADADARELEAERLRLDIVPAGADAAVDARWSIVVSDFAWSPGLR